MKLTTHAPTHLAFAHGPPAERATDGTADASATGFASLLEGSQGAVATPARAARTDASAKTAEGTGGTPLSATTVQPADALLAAMLAVSRQALATTALPGGEPPGTATTGSSGALPPGVTATATALTTPAVPALTAQQVGLVAALATAGDRDAKPSSVATAAALLPERSTLVAPGFLLP